MRKFFVKAKQINGNKIEIVNEDVNHIKNVLRLTIGDKIKICDTDNSINYVSEIQEIMHSSVVCSILSEVPGEAEGNVELHIFQGLPKADKMELIIQKGTELGVFKFLPVKFKRSIVKLSEKDETKKIERWKKISEVASKQSGRDIIPDVTNVKSVKEVCEQIKDFDLILVAYEMEEKNHIKAELQNLKNTKSRYKIGVIIGPEGGIEPEEIQAFKEYGAQIVSLGKRILRTETVALQISSIIMYELENN